MSIFKESFKDFVRKQIKIREAIISHGNKEGEARTNSPVVDLSNLGGPKELKLPSHAFYTNTLNSYPTGGINTGVKGYVVNVQLKTDTTTDVGGRKELFTTGSEYVVSSI